MNRRRMNAAALLFAMAAITPEPPLTPIERRNPANAPPTPQDIARMKAAQEKRERRERRAAKRRKA